MAKKRTSKIIEAVRETEKGLRKAGIEITHRVLSDRDAAVLIAGLLDDAAPNKRLAKAAKDYLRRVDVEARATEVFGAPAKAAAWLDRPNRALDGATPRSLCSTPEGTQRVLTVLGRIEHGVY